MSGFEVAGIVLGAFPLAISALEGYRQLARRMKFFNEIRAEYQKCLDDLRYNRLRFIRSIKKLLIPLEMDDEEINHMLANPGGEAWSNHPMAAALEARLDESYSLYLDTIDSIKITMEELNSELAMDVKSFQEKVHQKKAPGGSYGGYPSRLHNSLGKPNQEFQMYRLKFSLGESTRDRLFDQLGKYNDRLEKLLSSSDELSDLQKSRNLASKGVTASLVDVALCKFWYSASQFYEALLAAWKCNCFDQHYVYLQLQYRTSAEKDFQLLLMPLRSQKSGKWSSRQMKIKGENDVRTPESSHNQKKGLASHTSKVLVSPIANPSSNAKKKGKNVSFLPLSQVHQSSPPVFTYTDPTDHAHCIGSAENDVVFIDSLCRTMTENKGVDCAGYFEDGDCRYFLYPAEPGSESESPPVVTLDHLLLGKVGEALTRRQRYRLALVLASSFVQLQGSPWAAMPWDKSSILFDRELGQSESVLLDRLSVARGFDETSNNNKDSAGISGPLKTIKGLDSLAVILLELCFGCVLEAHKSRKEFPAGDDQTRTAFDFLAALEWCKEVNEEAGNDYAEAVKWCLDNYKFPPVNGDWRKEMIDKVVGPLERCWKYLIKT